MILIFTILCYLHGALSDTTQTFHSYKLETYLWPSRLVPLFLTFTVTLMQSVSTFGPIPLPHCEDITNGSSPYSLRYWLSESSEIRYLSAVETFPLRFESYFSDRHLRDFLMYSPTRHPPIFKWDYSLPSFGEDKISSGTSFLK